MYTVKRIAVLCVSLLCLITQLPVMVRAAEPEKNISATGSAAQLTLPGEKSYESFLTDCQSYERPESAVTLTANDIAANQSSDYSVETVNGRENVCSLNGEDSAVTYRFSVGTAGLYRLCVIYIQSDDMKITDPQFDILLDGEIPYLSAKSVTLPRFWTLSGEKQYDSRGNELHRSWVQNPRWKDQFVYDCEGRYNDPLAFYLSAGEHTLTFDFEYSGLGIEKVMFCNPPEAPAYSADGKTAAKGKNILIEAEDFTRSSDAVISVNIEKSDPGVTPNDAGKMQYNTVGGDSFAKAGQTIFWEMSVTESGYYYIGFKARQNIKKGFFSTRKLTVDGKLPYAECADLRFTYSDDWQQFVLSDAKGEPMLFYFEAGKTHELALECVLGQLSSTMTVLDECVETLNRLFLEVRMVVGNSADKYRDYYLEEDIPTLKKDIGSVLKQLEQQKKFVQSVGNTKGGDLSALQTMITQLKLFAEKTDNMALKLDSFKGNISSLSTWVAELKTQPLEIDSLTVGTELSEMRQSKSGFWGKFIFNLHRLILSFSKNYGVVGDYDSEKELTVWVSTGQDQLDVIRNLISQNYKRDCSVQLQLVPTGLLEAAMAGKGPDVAMFIAGDMPVNLASRGGLVDLSKLEGYDTVMERFMKNAALPYTYDGGCYALPLTQGFNMLFVRTDIFAQMGLSVPDTWDDFFALLPVLQRNHLGAGVPSDLSTFATFAMQNGGTYYNADMTATVFDNYPETLAFIKWTDLFTEKGLSLAYDFSNRFRTGEMPIGIADYSAYALLEASAPEISGRWSIYPVMATRDEKGELNRSVSCATVGTVGLQQGNTCAVILKDCKDTDAAWDFISWLTETDIQAAYGLELEKRMGVAARYTSANVDTLARLPWTGAEQQLLYAQWEHLVLLPEIPGSYYVTRNLTNAFRQVVYNQANPTHTLNRYNEIINREIERKGKGLQKGHG